MHFDIFIRQGERTKPSMVLVYKTGTDSEWRLPATEYRVFFLGRYYGFNVFKSYSWYYRIPLLVLP